MSGASLTMSLPSSRTWQQVLSVGLIGGVVAIYLCLVGIVSTFHQQQLISGVITLGQASILLTFIGAGYLAGRRADGSMPLVVAAGAAAGLLSGLALTLLILFSGVVNLQQVFQQASPQLWSILTLGRYPDDGLLGALIPTVLGTLVGAGSGAVAVLPRPVQRSIAAALLSVLIVGIFAGILRTPMLGSPLAALARTLFASQGLTVLGTIVTLSTALGAGIGSALAARFGARRGGAVGGVLGGLALSLAGGMLANEAGALVGGVIGIALGGVLGGLAERALTRAEVDRRYAALPRTQQRIALTPVLLLLLLLILVLPHAAGPFFAAVVAIVALYILMGLGLNITLGLAGLLDLGFVAFFAVGAYTVGLMTSLGQFGLLTLPSVELFGLTFGPFWFALPFAVLFAFIFGAFLGLPVLGIRGDYLAIATLGFGEIIAILARSDVLIAWLGGPQGVTLIPKPIIVPPTSPLSGPTQIYYIALVFAGVVAFVAYRLRDSRLGRAWVAIREDEDVAEALGINLVQTKLLAYMLGAAFAGLGGALFAAHIGAIFPSSINLFVSINVAAIVIVGGMGSIPGVVVGAIVLIGLPELLRDVGGTEYRFLFYGAVLILMMRFRPEGLLPSRVISRELHVEGDNVEATDAVAGAVVAELEAEEDE